MKPRSIFCAMALAGVCLLCNSCGESKNPLSDPLKAKPDAQLAGVWLSKEGGLFGPEIEYVHVGRTGDKLPSGVMRIVAVSRNRDGTLERPKELLAFSTSIGQMHYLNALGIEEKNLAEFDEKGWKPDTIKSYWLLKYQVEGDTLHVWIMDPAVQAGLIKAKKIKGTVSRKGEDSPMFTDTTENLAALLAAPENANLFDKESEVRYQRVK